MKSLLMALSAVQPQLMEVASQNDGANTKKLIMMGAMFVAFEEKEIKSEVKLWKEKLKIL